jgi:hypothetical protein
MGRAGEGEKSFNETNVINVMYVNIVIFTSFLRHLRHLYHFCVICVISGIVIISVILTAASHTRPCQCRVGGPAHGGVHRPETPPSRWAAECRLILL